MTTRRQKLLRYFFQWKILNQYHYYATLAPKLAPTRKNLIFRELNKDDFYRNKIFQKKGRLDRYQQHLKKGHRCFGFTTPDGDVAAYFWLTIGTPKSPLPNPAFKGFDWLIANNEAYIWDCRTIPDYQRQGLYREGLKRLVCYCRKNAITNIMISCEKQNAASSAGIQSAGFQFKGRTFAVKTKFFKFIYCSRKTSRFSLPNAPVLTKEVFPWH